MRVAELAQLIRFVSHLLPGIDSAEAATMGQKGSKAALESDVRVPGERKGRHIFGKGQKDGALGVKSAPQPGAQLSVARAL
jgi:hypothetical protein